MSADKITTYRDLDAWKEGHKLVVHIYEITKVFPKEEIFGLVSQMRRCAVSITSNIAEGFSRQSFKEKIQFYYHSLGSITELDNQLLICKDIGIINNSIYIDLSSQLNRVQMITNGLLRKTKDNLKNA